MPYSVLDPELVSMLHAWAQSKAPIAALYVFGSYARATASPRSDLDICVDIVDSVDDALAELIVNRAVWSAELSGLTGIVVKDIYLGSDAVAGPPRVAVFVRS